MDKLVEAVSRAPKTRSKNDDDFADRLSSRYTVVLLIVFAGLVGIIEVRILLILFNMKVVQVKNGTRPAGPSSGSAGLLRRTILDGRLVVELIAKLRRALYDLLAFLHADTVHTRTHHSRVGCNNNTWANITHWCYSCGIGLYTAHRDHVIHLL